MQEVYLFFLSHGSFCYKKCCNLVKVKTSTFSELIMQYYFTLVVGFFIYSSFALYASQTENLYWHPDVEMKCKKPIQGPPGPPGPGFGANYASVWSVTVVDLILNAPPMGVAFENSQIPGVGVIHPVGGDNTLFLIQNSGTYLIIWNVSASLTPTATLFDSASVAFTLFNVSTGMPFNPAINGYSTLTSQDIKTITGQTSLFIPAGTIIQLQVEAQLANGAPLLDMINRTLTITQIAP